MSDFGIILKRAKKMQDIKDKGGKWGRCEKCGERNVLFDYYDNKNEIWSFCEKCVAYYIKEEIL